MKKHWLYLKYVLRHKWFVYQEGRVLGLGVWQLLCHDLSKFLPDEWIPYARYFYGGPYRPWKDRTAAEKQHMDWNLSAESIEDAFNVAWLKHLHRNPHHWQHWVLREDSGNTKLLSMPRRYYKEMLADWIGAGRAIHGRRDIDEWYAANKDRILLHPDVRDGIEAQMWLTQFKNAPKEDE